MSTMHVPPTIVVRMGQLVWTAMKAVSNAFVLLALLVSTVKKTSLTACQHRVLHQPLALI